MRSPGAPSHRNDIERRYWKEVATGTTSETLFSSLKVERLHGQRFKTRREAKDEIIAWLLCYNRARLHSTLTYVSPMQFEQDWLANQPRQANSRVRLWDPEFALHQKQPECAAVVT